jgi:hypothetical protein
VVKGAVISGLQNLVAARKLKYHYGITLSHRFRPGIDSEADAYTCAFTGKKYARGYISWFAAKVCSIFLALLKNTYVE